MTLDGAGTLYVADFSNNKIRKITAAGVVSTLAGTGAQGAADGPGTSATFRFPLGVEVGGDGTLYVSDFFGHKIRKIILAAAAPTITSLSPASGPVGTSVTLTGTNLNGVLQVSFNGSLVSTFTSNTATQLVVAVPAGATSGPVTVTTPAGTSNALTFTITCPVATLAYDAVSYCQSAANPAPMVTGPMGGSFSSTAGLGLNSASGVINLAASIPGTYAVTYTGGTATCPTTATAQVTVTAAPSAAFGYGAPAYCPAPGALISPTLSSNAVAGTFTAAPAGLILDVSSGAIALASSQPGTYVVTNAVPAAGGCAAVSATTQVVVNAPPVASVVASGPTTFCQGGSVTLTANGGSAYTWSTGATSPSITVSTSGTYSVAVTNAAGCSATATATVTVTPGASAAFSYATASYCTTGATAVPTVTGTTGGTFSAPTGLSLDPSTGTIAPASSTPGTYAVTYTAGSSCPASASVQVTIAAPATAGFSYSSNSYCTTQASSVPAVLGLLIAAGG